MSTLFLSKEYRNFRVQPSGKAVSYAQIGLKFQAHNKKPTLTIKPALVIWIVIGSSELTPQHLNALNEVAIISEEKVVPIMDFITSYAETAATMGLDKIRRKKYQEELLHHRENLEEMVKERTAELRASEEKSRLL